MEQSEFTKIFGKRDADVFDCIAVIRNKFLSEITEKIDYSSAMSSPECVLFAIYKILEEKSENESKMQNMQ